MYEHIKDKDIKAALINYKDKIDATKSNQLDLGTYRVEKPWGHEVWLEINEFYAYKMISMNAGNRSSLQAHEKKIEANCIISGEAEVLLEDENGVLQSRIYKAGDGWVVPVGKKHRVIAKTNYVALEVSTPHLDDVIRFSDDNLRPNGRIDSEHIKK
jgi:mannose-6-phosphate isomerase